MVTINKKENMKKVMVLMSTYNGEKYLETQLDSILAQEGVQVEILVRDDGSTDTTLSILNKYKQKGKLNYYTGPNVGPTRSFMDLIHKAPKSDFYAFSDQDDYWLPGKLLRGIKLLMQNKYNIDTPMLYHSQTLLVDEKLVPLQLKKGQREIDPYFSTNFIHAILSSLAIGCTFVFNYRLLEIIKYYQPSFKTPHDIWVDRVCWAVGGHVIHDVQSHIYYRQHAKNVSGGVGTFFTRWKRRVMTLLHHRCTRSQCVAELFIGYSAMMPAENLRVCELILHYKKDWKTKWKLLIDSQFRTPNSSINRMYIINILLGSF